MNLISDEEGEASAVTIAYTRNSKPGATFKQWTKPAADKEHEAGKGGTCHYISEQNLACEDKDHENCECECGQHRHFLSADDRGKVRLVITVPAPAT